MENIAQVLHQMRDLGIDLRDKDLDKIDAFMDGKRTTIGKGGKAWFKFYRFSPRSGGTFITGAFGKYNGGGAWEKVENDWAPMPEVERERMRSEREAAAVVAAAAREEARRVASLDALELWREASPTGASPYLERKGLRGESCRYLRDGTLVILMMRYDLAREASVQAAQRILPDGRKFFSKGFAKPGCALRLGAVDDATHLLVVCEGYATGLTIREALERSLPVFVAFDAGNLLSVVPLLRRLYPDLRILICADDDHLTVDPITKKLNNPGRTTARAAARITPGVEVVYPIFDARRREKGDTDFDDLRIRQGIDACRRQLRNTVRAMEAVRG